jgi:hypothetical protein
MGVFPGNAIKQNEVVIFSFFNFLLFSFEYFLA